MCYFIFKHILLWISKWYIYFFPIQESFLISFLQQAWVWTCTFFILNSCTSYKFEWTFVHVKFKIAFSKPLTYPKLVIYKRVCNTLISEHLSNQQRQLVIEPYNIVMKTKVKKCWVIILFAFFQFFCHCPVQHYF